MRSRPTTKLTLFHSFVALLIVLGVAMCTPSFAAATEDTEAPQLQGLSFEPAEVDVTSADQHVTVKAHVTDNVSGSQRPIVEFRSPGGTQEAQSILNRVSGSNLDGIYEGVVTIHHFAEQGTWRIHSFFVADEVGNVNVIKTAQLEADGFPVALQVDPPPSVTEVNPVSGPEGGGTAVEISGTGLASTTSVQFGSNAATNISINSANLITATAPPGTGTVDVVVTTPNGTSATGPSNKFQYAPVVSLTSNLNPSIRGQKETLTAKVIAMAGGAPTPTGSVAFVEGSTILGVVGLAKGVASFGTSSLNAGNHEIVAEYSGDSYFGAGTSTPLVQVVTPASTELALTSSLNPAPYGSSASIKAVVKAVAPGAGTPSGTVTFSAGSTVLATVPLSGSSAKYALKTVPPGGYEITATYNGDGNYEASESSISQLVTKASTELSLTSSLNPAPYGSSGTLKATVKAIAPGAGAPPGTVTFREGSTVLATVPLSGTTAKYALKSFAPGAHEITATYNGDPNYEASESMVAQTITKASTELTLTSSKNPASHGSSGTLKATVKAVAPGAGTPVGTVIFGEGEAVLATVPLSGNTATYPLKSLTVGTHEVTASYSGNTNYESSEAAISQVIIP